MKIPTFSFDVTHNVKLVFFIFWLQLYPTYPPHIRQVHLLFFFIFYCKHPLSSIFYHECLLQHCSKPLWIFLNIFLFLILMRNVKLCLNIVEGLQRENFTWIFLTLYFHFKKIFNVIVTQKCVVSNTSLNVVQNDLGYMFFIFL